RGDVGGGDAADPARLAEREGSDALELLAGFCAKLRGGSVVQAGRDRVILESPGAVNLVELAIAVTIGFCLDRDLVGHVLREVMVAKVGVEGQHMVPGRLRAPQDLEERIPLNSGAGQEAAKLLDSVAAGLEPGPSMVVNQPDAPSQFREPEVGVVVSEH